MINSSNNFLNIFIIIIIIIVIIMGAKLCTLSGSCVKDCIKPKQNITKFTKTFKRKTEKKTTIDKNLALEEEWILAFPELKQSRKRVHPCSTRFRGGSLISELAQDSLCLLEKTKNHREKEELVDEGLTSNCSLITNNLCGKSQKKRVNFKLPHTVIFYKPEEPYCEEEEDDEEEASLKGYYNINSEEDSFSSLYSFETAEEPSFRLAVDILPYVFVSSKVSN